MMRNAQKKCDASSHEAHIENLSHDGKGIARINGKVTFIQGALPGEVITFRYTRQKKDFDEGVLLQILQPSSLRVEPKCQQYAVCGGCSLQHLDEEQQIQFKEQHLIDLLSRFANTTPQTLLPSLYKTHWNYRHRGRLSVRYVEKKQTAVVGFRERNNPRYIAEMTHCPIFHPKLDQDIIALRALVNSLEDKHSIAQIEVAAGDDDIALILRHLTPLNAQDEEKICSFANEFNYLIFLQPGGPDSIHRFYPKEEDEYLTYNLALYNLTLKFHPSDFTQINPELNRAMIPLALSLLDLKPTDVVLDLFCGLGNFSLPMAKFCAKVIGVEGSKTMVERAYMNARANQLSNVEFYTTNLDDATAVSNLAQYATNKMLIDPPRTGALALVNQIEQLNPQRIVYVSCNPVTLARDTAVLVHQKGYTLDKAGVMDMFPHTTHVESIALFIKE